MRADIEVIGSINVDTILSVARLPSPGDTVLARSVDRMPGGKGANQAVAAARMGARVAMTGAVGADRDGAWMRDVLEGEGIDTGGVRIDPSLPTGSAMIAVDPAGENQIIVLPGANAALTGQAMDSGLAPAPVLLAQLEVPIPILAQAFARTGVVRILNAAPFVAEAAGLFPDTDMIVVNEHELAGYARLGASPDESAMIDAARSLMAFPDQIVVVTLGAGGVAAITASACHRIPAVPVIARDTVGAGDCFCGALAAGIAEGMRLIDALHLANAAASLSTQAAGALPAMPGRAAVDAILAHLERSAPSREYAPAIKHPSGAFLDRVRSRRME